MEKSTKKLYKEFDPEEFVKNNKDGWLVVVSAPRRTGKTVLITDWIARMQDIRKWDKIYLFSETAFAQSDAYQFIPNDCKSDHLDLPKISEILAEQTEARIEHDMNPEKPMRRVLLIFDDIINAANIRKKNDFSKIATTGRHYRVDCIAITQHLKAFSPVFRTNADIFVVWRSLEFCQRECVVENYLMLSDGKKSEIKKSAFNLLNNICNVQYRACIIENHISSYAKDTSDYVRYYLANPNAKPKMIGEDTGRLGCTHRKYNYVNNDGKDRELNLRFKIRSRK